MQRRSGGRRDQELRVSGSAVRERGRPSLPGAAPVSRLGEQFPLPSGPVASGPFFWPERRQSERPTAWWWVNLDPPGAWLRGKSSPFPFGPTRVCSGCVSGWGSQDQARITRVSSANPSFGGSVDHPPPGMLEQRGGLEPLFDCVVEVGLRGHPGTRDSGSSTQGREERLPGTGPREGEEIQGHVWVRGSAHDVHQQDAFRYDVRQPEAE